MQLVDNVGLVFGMASWPVPVAVAWVLTRNKDFMAGCPRQRDDGLGPLDTECANWRFNIHVNRVDLHRTPLMLFPSAASAYKRLRAEVRRDWHNCYPQKEVLAAFPEGNLDEPDQARVVASVWRALNPNDQDCVSLSGAAWWLASDRGTKVIVLDDVRVWEPAFKEVVSLPIFSDGERVPSNQFLAASFTYPCGAWYHWHGPNHMGQFVKCDLEGDDVFNAHDGTKRPRLVVRSADLIALRPLESFPATAPTVGPVMDATAILSGDVVEIDDEEAASTLASAIKNKLGQGLIPGNTITWALFCADVRDDADGWINKRDGKPKRGFGDRTIRRIVEGEEDVSD
jgi:hypothetical protein